MKTEVRITERVTRIIDIDFPYYYKHDFYSEYGENVIYGKITEKTVHSIQEQISYFGKIEYTIEEDTWTKDGSYLTPEHLSSEKEYEEVKQRAIDFLNSL